MDPSSDSPRPSWSRVNRSSGPVAFVQCPSFLEQKAAILSTGLVQPSQEEQIAPAGRPPRKLRKQFKTVRTDSAAIFILRELSMTGSPAMAPEGSLKAEQTWTFLGEVLQLPTLAAFVHCSKQALGDVPGLRNLNATLISELERVAENQLLYGDATGSNIAGIIPDATPFNTSILEAPYYKVDNIGAASAQLSASGFTATFAVLHPYDWFKMLNKKTAGESVCLAEPANSGRPASLRLKYRNLRSARRGKIRGWRREQGDNQPENEFGD